MRASQFHTKAKHDEGTKVLLDLPDGTPTEEFVVLRGRDSEAFRKAQAAYRDRMVAAKSEEKPFDSHKEGILLTVSAIKSWSLEEPLTEAAACELLTNAPYLLDKMDAALYDNKRFFDGKE